MIITTDNTIQKHPKRWLKWKNNRYTFSAIIRSPASRVGDMEADGIDLGSAKDDLNIMLTLNAVNAAFASSEQTFNTFDNQQLFEFETAFNSFETKGSEQTNFLLLHSVFSVPPLSTSARAAEDPIVLGTLQGSHFEPWKNGSIEDAFKGEIPKTLIVAEEPQEDFISEINPTTKGDFEQLSLRNSAASDEQTEPDENDRAEYVLLNGRGFVLGRRKSE